MAARARARSGARSLPLRTRGPGWLRMAARRNSRAAIWCQRLAVFCVPYLLIVVLGHRSGAIETPATLWLLGLAAALLVLSVALGLIGFHDLWTRGDRGGMRSLRGLVLAGLMLAPFAWSGLLAFTLPPIHDVSTDLTDPPDFEAAEVDRDAAANPIRAPDGALQLAAYPTLAARRYTGDIDLVARAVFELVSERDWTVLAEASEDRVDPIDVEDSAATARPVLADNGAPLRVPVPRTRPDPAAADVAPEIGTTRVAAGERSGDLSQVRARDEADERYVEALAASPVLGLPADVVIRLTEVDDVTIVDMRSASRYGAHDLGDNARRIEAFMNDLDEVLGNLSRG